MPKTTTEVQANTREEAMDLAIAPVMKAMSANELAQWFRNQMTGRKNSIEFILGDMSHTDLAVAYVENCDDDALETWTGAAVVDKSNDDETSA